jgi:hypothetical protein
MTTSAVAMAIRIIPLAEKAGWKVNVSAIHLAFFKTHKATVRSSNRNISLIF